ncbi:MAG TPA: type II toxin-antitoxin system VapC family toxin [Thermoanaerobaculia bacterium]|nr:type II toxin-antitoxin system VapC family toxin [Thermoanaerobaculia bacterium]
MAAIFLDTNIFLYAVGADQSLREASQQVLRRVAEGDLVATTNSEVVQEIIFVLGRRGRKDEALDLARSTILLFPDLLPVTRSDMLAACELMERYPSLPPRDAIHAATMINNGIGSILSVDHHFDDVVEITRLPLDL